MGETCTLEQRGRVALPVCDSHPGIGRFRVRRNSPPFAKGRAGRALVRGVPMSSAPSTDARTLAAEMKRQLQQYRAEHLQLEANMRWRLERELEASRAEHADLMARMNSSIAMLEHAAEMGITSSMATLELATATPTGAEVPNSQASSSQPAHQVAVLSHPRPTAMPATADAILPGDWTPQSPIYCLLPDDLLERIANELQSGVVWQTCAFLRHRRLNSIEALVLSSCKLQILEVPIGGSRDALVLRLWHQLNAGRAIMRQLRSTVGEVIAAADQAGGYPCRYAEPWMSCFNAIDIIQSGNDVHGQGLSELSPDMKQYFADDLPALLRDQRPWASDCVNGGIKQEFFHHLRDGIHDFLAGQAEPHRARLLVQAAEDMIDPRIEAALANRDAECDAASTMRLLKEFVSKNGYLLSERQRKVCILVINSPTISEKTRDCAIELIEENDSQNAKAQAALPVPPPPYTEYTMGGQPPLQRQEDGCTLPYHSITCTILMDEGNQMESWGLSFEELRFEDYCKTNAIADGLEDPSAGSLAS